MRRNEGFKGEALGIEADAGNGRMLVVVLGNGNGAEFGT